MVSKIFGLAVYGDESAPYFQDDFNQVLDSHIEFLKTAGETSTETIDKRYIGRYIGDFYSILRDMSIHPRYHRIVMLLNGFTNPIEFNGQIDTVFLPDVSEVDSIMSIYNTSRSKITKEQGL